MRSRDLTQSLRHLFLSHIKQIVYLEQIVRISKMILSAAFDFVSRNEDKLRRIALAQWSHFMRLKDLQICKSESPRINSYYWHFIIGSRSL